MSKTKKELKEASQKRTLEDFKNQINWWRRYEENIDAIIKTNPLAIPLREPREKEVNKCNKK